MGKKGFRGRGLVYISTGREVSTACLHESALPVDLVLLKSSVGKRKKLLEISILVHTFAFVV
jgi:hypothetical protein